ncbi:unnamed protein product [Eruca vesicaria subsp. sativa]|uniref:Uncharacterized protein n=1 Tax=Eruca vesicaria subsp. sativa TaxID=29727 RepID=A0ABC8K524_ERUVS|nr:unnamed protein product [Eruca vesicaria subsp. sativa]
MEKELHQKVRVRHLIVKPEPDIYPQWDDDKVDDALHNLITDILHGTLDDTYWSTKARNAPTANREKRKLLREEEACMKKKSPKVKTSAPCGDDTFRHDLMEMMNTLTTKIGSMDTIIVEKVLTAVETTIDAKIDAKVDARVCQAELVLNKKIYFLL